MQCDAKDGVLSAKLFEEEKQRAFCFVAVFEMKFSRIFKSCF